MSKLNRNDLCACGSGKKYKKCCLAADSVFDLHYRRWERVRRGLVSKLIDFVFDCLGPTIFADGWNVFLDGEGDVDFDPESPITLAFYPWFYFTWEFEVKPESGGKYFRTTIADLFVRERGDLVTDDEKAVLSSMVGHPFSLCEIVNVTPGKSMTLFDLFRREKYDVTEPQTSLIFSRGHILYCATAELDGFTTMIGFSPHPLRSSHKREISRLRKWIVEQIETNEITGAVLKEFEADIRGVYLARLVPMLEWSEMTEPDPESSIPVVASEAVNGALAAVSEASSQTAVVAASGGAAVKFKTTFDFDDSEGFATSDYEDIFGAEEDNDAAIQQSLQFMAQEGAAIRKDVSKSQKAKTPKRVVPTQSPDTEELLDPSSVLCKELFKLAGYLYKFAPWQFMEETEVFGCQDPHTGEVGFISVMGGLGQYKAVAVYSGEEALYKWRHFEELLNVDPQSEEAHDLLLEIPQLQLAFCPSRFLEKRDREMIKSSGIKFGNQKPLFRCYRPGYLPWFLTLAEARQLKCALEQTLAVAKQFSYDPNLIPINEDPEDNEYLVRTPQVEGERIRWKNSIRQVQAPNTMVTPFGVEGTTVDKLSRLQKFGAQEVGLFTLPAKVGEPGERPLLLYALLLTDSETGLVCGFELLHAVDGIDLMYADIAEKASAIWLRHGSIPSELRGRSARLLNMFQCVADEVGFSLSLVDELPTMDEAKKALIDSMKAGRV